MAFAGIDKLDVRVPKSVRFTSRFQRVYDRLRDTVFKPHSAYRYHANFSKHGFDVHLYEHSRAKGRDEWHNRLSVLRAGRLTATQMAAAISAVFDTDPLDLEVMRVDLACDVSIPTWWVGTHIDVPQKRKIDVYGHRSHGARTPFRITERASGTSFYLGGQPDYIRIYDKAAESRFRYRELARKVQHQLPSFVDLYGHEPDATLTRIERELHVEAIPPKLHTVRDLFRNAANFDPFDAVVVFGGDNPAPDENLWTMSQLLTGYGIRYLVRERGLAATRRMLNERGRRASERLRRYASFLPHNDYPAPDLYAAYKSDVLRQLAHRSVQRRVG